MTDDQAIDTAADTALERSFWHRHRHHVRWIAEALVLLALYMLYNRVRASVQGSEDVALRNAELVFRMERAIGLAIEEQLQQMFLDNYTFISFWNIYYGTIHFVMPVVALIWLYRKAPVRYIRWRNTFFFMLGLGVVAFWFIPLAPPRFMPEHYGFVDTAIGYMNFGKPATTKSEAGNFFAAMPSLHMGWSTWSSCALWPMVRRWWAKTLLVMYPLATLFAIMVTGNHWWLDAVGGWMVLATAYGIARLTERFFARQIPRRTASVSAQTTDGALAHAGNAGNVAD